MDNEKIVLAAGLMTTTKAAKPNTIETIRAGLVAASRKIVKWVHANPKTAACIGITMVGGLVYIITPMAVVGPVMAAGGWSAGGPVAGSFAAGIHASIGNVAAGSVFATVQSAAMGGAGAAVVAGAVQSFGGVMVAAAVAAVGWFMSNTSFKG